MKIASIVASVAIVAGTAAAAAQAPSKPDPIVPLHTLMTADDYPAEAAVSNQQGTVRFRLQVGSDGLVKSCSITASSGSKLLDDASCQIITSRARFNPARDASGRAVDGAYENSITWALAEDPLAPRIKMAVSLWFTCTIGEASKLVLSTLPPDQVAAKALTGCTELERRVESELKLAGAPVGAAAGLKGELRSRIGVHVTEARETLSASADAK